MRQPRQKEKRKKTKQTDGVRGVVRFGNFLTWKSVLIAELCDERSNRTRTDSSPVSPQIVLWKRSWCNERENVVQAARQPSNATKCGQRHLQRVRTDGSRVAVPATEWAVGSRKSSAGSRTQEAGSRKQEARSRKQEELSRKQEAGSRKRSAGSRKQETESRKSSAGRGISYQDRPVVA